MTLTDVDVTNNSEQNNMTLKLDEQPESATIGANLQACIQQARDQGRLTCGVYQCTLLLQIEPDEVMLCVLPVLSGAMDVAQHIHYTLLEAFCWENDIRLVHADSVDKLSLALLSGSPGPALRQQLTDCSCLLVQYPHEEASLADEEVLAFHKTTRNEYPQPVVHLPD